MYISDNKIEIKANKISVTIYTILLFKKTI